MESDMKLNYTTAAFSANNQVIRGRGLHVYNHPMKQIIVPNSAEAAQS
jgi:hypothetical protein